MVKHTKIGIKGEQIATDFLQKKGYTILNRNWRAGNKELDIVAQKGDTIVFCEIKTRTSHEFGFPEEAVTRRKQQHIKMAAAAWQEANPGHDYIRFDIVAILLDDTGIKEIMHFEEAFY
jgi:putative endonuclease